MSAAGYQSVGRPRPSGKPHTWNLINFNSEVGPVPLACFAGLSTSVRSTALLRGSPARGLVVAHARRKWYAVFEPASARGTYRVWDQVKELVSGQSQAVHKGFPNEAAALAWISHLTHRAKAQDAVLEPLRQRVLGPERVIGHHAPREATVALPSRGTNKCTTSVNGCNAAQLEVAAAAPASAEGASRPRPWETEPLVLQVPTAPSREYYKKWYAVRFLDGGSPGVYTTWPDAEAAINGRYAEHRSFDSQAEAIAYAFGPAFVDLLLPAATSPQAQPAAQAAECNPHQQQQEPLIFAEDATTHLGLLEDQEFLGFTVAPGWTPAASTATSEPSFWRGPGQDMSGEYQVDELPSSGGSVASTLADHIGDPLRAPASAVGSQAQQASCVGGGTGSSASWDAASAPLWPAAPGDTSQSSGWLLRTQSDGQSGAVGSTGGISGRAGLGSVGAVGTGGLGLPLPAPLAITVPMSYDTSYGGMATGMVLTAASAGLPGWYRPCGGAAVRSAAAAAQGGAAGPVAGDDNKEGPYLGLDLWPGSDASKTSASDREPGPARLGDEQMGMEAVGSRGPEGRPSEAPKDDTPATSIPAKRGRGRPPKAISGPPGFPALGQQTADAPSGSGRDNDAAAVAKAAAGAVERRRGRPRKAVAASDGSGGQAVAERTRPRGRPRKLLTESATTEARGPDPPRRPRGRPSKALAAGAEWVPETEMLPVVAAAAVHAAVEDCLAVGASTRKRGRPPQSQLEEHRAVLAALERSDFDAIVHLFYLGQNNSALQHFLADRMPKLRGTAKRLVLEWGRQLSGKGLDKLETATYGELLRLRGAFAHMPERDVPTRSLAGILLQYVYAQAGCTDATPEHRLIRGVTVTLLLQELDEWKRTQHMWHRVWPDDD